MSLDPVNPKLKAIVSEIEAILKREDVAGMVMLCSGEQSEFMNFIASPNGPSWSALLWEGTKGAMRIRCKAKKDHAERFKWVSTLKMIHTMRDVCALQFGAYNALCEATKEFVEVTGESAFKEHEP